MGWGVPPRFGSLRAGAAPGAHAGFHVHRDLPFVVALRPQSHDLRGGRYGIENDCDRVTGPPENDGIAAPRKIAATQEATSVAANG